MSPIAQFENDRFEAIVKTIVFFDLFDYPLTAYEIGKYCAKIQDLASIMTTLERETSQPGALIQQKNGFYFLTGREAIISIRQERYNHARRKIKIARRFGRLLNLSPSVRLIAVANLIGDHNLRDQSDIDFFIITASRRLWLTRLYCAGLAKALNLRPTAKKKRDRICLSFYVSAAHLDLEDLRLPGADPYFDYWRRSLVLLYNKGRIGERFRRENGLVDDFRREMPSSEKGPSGSERPGNRFLDYLEKMAKKIQLKIMPAALQLAANNSDGVVISDTVLKLYLGDRRREYAQKYGDKIHEILKKNA